MKGREGRSDREEEERNGKGKGHPRDESRMELVDTYSPLSHPF